MTNPGISPSRLRRTSAVHTSTPIYRNLQTYPAHAKKCSPPPPS